MNFINGLKEQALRRVLVMVLRRSIGMFLEDDIVLDVSCTRMYYFMPNCIH